MTDYTNTVLYCDVREGLQKLKDAGVKAQCVVTSPPYWGLRDYQTKPVIFGGDPSCGHDWNGGIRPANYNYEDKIQAKGWDAGKQSAVSKTASACCLKCGAWRGQLGLEPTPQAYIANMVEVFRGVRDVLAEDGTCWVNIGDSYCGSGTRTEDHANPGLSKAAFRDGPQRKFIINTSSNNKGNVSTHGIGFVPGLKPKDLVGIPWMLAFALRDDGWWLRCDIIWHKPNPMPESVRDRPTRNHEYVFLLSKNRKYFYDADAIQVRAITAGSNAEYADYVSRALAMGRKPSGNEKAESSNIINADFRNARSVWTIATQPYPGFHFATFPQELAKKCILAGSRPGDIVLDPFMGSGTTGQVAENLGRKWIGIELNENYRPLIEDRTRQMGLGI